MEETSELLDNIQEYLHNGNFIELNKIIEQVEWIEKHHDLFLIIKIAILVYEEKYNDALNLCDKFQNENEMHYEKGFLYFNMIDDENLDNAIKELSKVKLEDSDIAKHNYEQAQLWLLDCYSQKKDLGKFKEFAKKLCTYYQNRELPDEEKAEIAYLYLINAFIETDSNKKEEYLERFFNDTNDNFYFGFCSIVIYSGILDFEPKDVFTILKKCKWYENDKYFNQILNSIKIEDNDLDKYVEIWFYQNLIMNQIMLGYNTPLKKIYHHTSLSSLDPMVTKSSPIRMCSIASANDKVEGEVLSMMLKDMKVINNNVNNEPINNYLVVQTSYGRREHSLTMFRLYGKKDEKEGTGVCIEFNKSFFNCNPTALKFSIEKEKIKISNRMDKRKPICWMMYYHEGKDEIYFYPYEDELEPCRINLKKSIKNVKWDKQSNHEKDGINQINLEYAFVYLIDAIKSLNDEEKQSIAMKILYKLRYFIKSSGFADEKELRMADIVSIDEIPPENNQNMVLFQEYLPIYQYNGLNRLIFGPKVENFKVMREYYMKKVRERYKNIRIDISDAPLA